MPSVEVAASTRKPEPRGTADDEIPTMGDLVGGLGEIEFLVGDEQRQMCGDVAKRADAEHAPHVDQVAVAGDAPQRRHRQGHAQKNQRPETGAVDQVVDRARAVQNGVGVIHRFGERQQQQHQRADPQRRKMPAPVKPDVPRDASSLVPGRAIRLSNGDRRKMISGIRKTRIPFGIISLSLSSFPRLPLYRTAQFYLSKRPERASIFLLIRFVTTVHKVGRKEPVGAKPTASNYGR